MVGGTEWHGNNFISRDVIIAGLEDNTYAKIWKVWKRFVCLFCNTVS